MKTPDEEGGAPEGSTDHTISMARANIYGLLLVPPILLIGAPFGLLWGWGALFSGLLAFSFLGSFIPTLILGIVAHEFIHGLAWALAARRPWSSIALGFQLKTLTPYAHCREPIEAGAYRVGAAAPGVALGLLPLALATATGNGWLLWFGLFFTLAAAGDLIILLTLRGVPAHRLVKDHPTRAGCIVL